MQGKHFVVVYTERQGRIRIISARKANTREIQAHGQQRADAPEV
ncbi:BrnT family toxin [Synechococcus sp. CCY9202]